MRFYLLAVVVLISACSRSETVADGQYMYSRTDRGKLGIAVTGSFKTSPEATYDRIIDVARKDLGLYTAEPARWEWVALHRSRGNPRVFSVMFRRELSYDGYIMVPVAPDGHTFGPPTIIDPNEKPNQAPTR